MSTNFSQIQVILEQKASRIISTIDLEIGVALEEFWIDTWKLCPDLCDKRIAELEKATKTGDFSDYGKACIDILEYYSKDKAMTELNESFLKAIKSKPYSNW